MRLVSREQIYDAVFQIVRAIPGLQVASRSFALPSDLDPSLFPALFCEEQPEERIVTETGQLAKWRLQVDVTIYVGIAQSVVPIGQETNYPATQLNAIIDAVEQAFHPPFPLKQTLGGLVQHAEISGRIDRVTGLPGKSFPVSMAIVPVIITAV